MSSQGRVINFFSASVNANDSSLLHEQLIGLIISGSLFVSLISYAVAGVWLVFSLDLRTHLTLCHAMIVWALVVVWGVVSSLLLTSMLAIFVEQILATARSYQTDQSDLQLRQSNLTPQYVVAIGLSVGILLNYRNIGRGWI